MINNKIGVLNPFAMTDLFRDVIKVDVNAIIKYEDNSVIWKIQVKDNNYFDDYAESFIIKNSTKSLELRNMHRKLVYINNVK